MATTQDASLGFIEEVTYKTAPGAVTRWAEFIAETIDWKKATKQGMGLRVGRRVGTSGRRVNPTADGQGTIELELLSKGQGLFWKWALGSNVSTLVSAATYQTVGTLADSLPSFVTQVGLVEGVAAATVDATTFLGCVVDSFEIDMLNADIGHVKLNLDIGDYTSATGYAAPSYPTAPNQFHFGNWSVATGVLTAPTTTALAAGATPITDQIRSATLTVNNNLSKSRLNGGGGGRKSKPLLGIRDITLKIDVEYGSTVFRDAVVNDTPMNLVFTYTGGALGVGTETFQVVLPEVKFDSPLPQSNGSDLIVTSFSATVLDNQSAAQPLWIVTRSADSAL